MVDGAMKPEVIRPFIEQRSSAILSPTEQSAITCEGKAFKRRKVGHSLNDVTQSIYMKQVQLL
jgi:hypothetical protein